MRHYVSEITEKTSDGYITCIEYKKKLVFVCFDQIVL